MVGPKVLTRFHGVWGMGVMSCIVLVALGWAPWTPPHKPTGQQAKIAEREEAKLKLSHAVGSGDSSLSQLNQAYGQLPLSFEPNVGQASGEVKFLSRGRGYTLYLTGEGVVLALRSQESEVRSQETERETGKWKLENVISQLATKHLPIATGLLRMKLRNANPLGLAKGLDQRPGTVNYFIGSDPKKWRTNVPTYAKVRYKNVYPGIDLIYHNNPTRTGQLEYDFVVASGADPRSISMTIDCDRPSVVSSQLSVERRDGQSKIALAPNGDLIINSAGNEVRFQKPVVYQEKPQVDSPNSKGKKYQPLRIPANRQSSIENLQFLDGGYILSAGNQIGFEVGAYDKSRPLIIDPVLSYSTYLGGSGFDYAYGIAVDSSGNAYVTGQTDSIDFPTVGAVQSSGGGSCKDPLGYSYVCFDAFVAKLNPAGSALVYATYLGGRDDDHGTGIAVDSAGNAYVTGYTDSTDFPTVNAFQGTLGGGNCGSSLPCLDAFVAKLNPAGSALLYSTYLGGTGNDIASGIAIDLAGSAYVAG